MFGMFNKEPKWPTVQLDEIVKRARLLVIDDQEFIYDQLFKKYGYNLDKWDDVVDLSKLEQNYYDIIMLDVQGVGITLSSDQGLGVLRHIREKSPAQLVIAFSNAEFSLKYNSFFELADATLSKSSDFVEFKRKVDELLSKRFSLGFYVEGIATATGVTNDVNKLTKIADKAIRQNKLENIREYLLDKAVDPKSINKALSIAQVALKVYVLCHK